jgi:uncharacterized protein (TIGR02147 family)
MPRRPPTIDLYAFLDYRAYLREVYAAKKAEGRGFSFRAFSARAGLGAPNHLKRVMEGDRNLSNETALRYARALGLNPTETAYFADLVMFNQASTDGERNSALDRLSRSRGYRRANRLELAHAAYHAAWYYPAIRELAAVVGFQCDPAWIAQRLLPPITPADAAKALDVLFDLGLLVKEEDGRVVQGEAIVTTGAETRGLHVRNYHRAMLERAAESLALVPAPARDISAITFATDDDTLELVKRRIQAFRQELVAFVAERPGGTRVAHLGMQLFPLTSEEPP